MPPSTCDGMLPPLALPPWIAAGRSRRASGEGPDRDARARGADGLGARVEAGRSAADNVAAAGIALA
ncbi:MAG: hypothetical protein U1E62_07885 [Alsobacter sp.]